jgi:hypothetical protein
MVVVQTLAGASQNAAPVGGAGGAPELGARPLRETNAGQRETLTKRLEQALAGRYAVQRELGRGTPHQEDPHLRW